MEIHAPHHPVLTLREALVHLAIVTVGILIALSLEGAREWHEHSTQVVEARHHLLDEVRANKEELEQRFLAKVDATRKENAQTSALAQRLIDGDKSVDLEWHSNYPLIYLQSASFATAQTTGVFALMDYEEARRFSAVYRLQGTFEAQHELGVRSETTMFSIGVMITGTAERQRARVNVADVSEWRRRIAELDTAVFIQSQIGTRLDGAYRELLGETPAPSLSAPPPSK